MSNISPSYKVPGLYVTVGFGQGALSPLNAPRTVLCVDYGTSSGTVAVNTPTVVFNADDARTKFGPGSHLHLGAQAFFEEYPDGTFYGLRYAEAAGTAAEYTITIATNAGSTGAYYVTVNGLGNDVEVVVTSGDTPTTQATAGAAAINARADLPVTATSALGVITCVWKHKGARGNQAKIRVTSNVSATTYVVAQSVVGATDGNPSTALDTIMSTDYDFIVTGANVTSSSTGLTPFVARVVTRAGALIGLRGQCIGASNDSYATAAALALAQNEPRAQVVWCRGADLLTVEMACKMGAVRAREEGIDPAVNLDFVKFKAWRGPFTASDKILISEAAGGLNNGLTSIIDGKIVRSITTRFQDALGGPDYRVLDTAKVAVPDYIADVLASDWVAKGYQNWKARQDSTDQKAQDKVLTPIIVKDWILTILYQAQNQRPIVLEGVDDLRDNVVVTLGGVVPGRFDGDVPLNVIEGAHQFDLGVHQIG
jgi:phage tail sheath gpL-like